MRKLNSKLIKTLARNIKHLRSQMGISQEELADKCGLHRTYIGAVERGERNITLSTLELIASALNVDAPKILSKTL